MSGLGMGIGSGIGLGLGIVLGLGTVIKEHHLVRNRVRVKMGENIRKGKEKVE
jgi:hypothetical protein